MDQHEKPMYLICGCEVNQTIQELSRTCILHNPIEKREQLTKANIEKAERERNLKAVKRAFIYWQTRFITSDSKIIRANWTQFEKYLKLEIGD